MCLVIVDQHQSNLFAICLYIRLNLTLLKIGSSGEKVNATLQIIAHFLRRKSRSAVIKVVRGLK
jgi:hypothetical protein